MSTEAGLRRSLRSRYPVVDAARREQGNGTLSLDATMTATPFSYVWLLPLLESPRDRIEANLQAALDALQLKSPVNAPDVSLREVVAIALNSSGYWARLAVNWVEAGFPLDARLIEQIDIAVKEKQWDQSTRHRLYRAAKRSSNP